MTASFSSSCCIPRRIVSALLAFVLLIPDPIAAAGFRSSSPAVSLPYADPFRTEALNPNPVAAPWGTSSLARAGVFALILSLLPGSLLAQQKRPLVERLPVPEAPAIERQNIRLTDSEWKSIWHRSANPARVTDESSLRQEVVRGNLRMSEMFYRHRAAWQALIAIRRDEGRSTTIGIDTLRAPGVAFIGPPIDQAILLPGVSVSHPKRQGSAAVEDEQAPGKGFWKGLGDNLMKAIRGYQWVSRNQVETEFLWERGQAFEIRKAYADLEQTAVQEMEEALRSALAYDTQSARRQELRESVRAQELLLDRERRAAGPEGRGPEAIYRFQTSYQQALQDLQAAESALEKIRIQWLASFSGSAESLIQTARGSQQPAEFSPRPGHSLLERADRIPALLEQEHARLRVPAPLPLLPPETAGTVELLFRQKTAALKILWDGTEDIPPAADPGQDPMWKPVPEDSPLATSPMERRLMLQKELLETVEKQLLELRKEPTWRAGFHFALGTLPYFASLMNFDRTSPDASTVRSLDDWIVHVSLRQNEIDSQIAQEQARIREAFLIARAERQNAWVQLAATRTLIARAQAQWSAAVQTDTRYVSADALTPYLEIRRLEKVYARQWKEARAATRLMEFYTTEVQVPLMQDVADHYAEVTRQLESEAPAGKPVARLRGWIIPAILTLIGAFLPAAAQAHTFSAPALAYQTATAGSIAGGVQRVALEVTLGRYRTGHSENTLSGIVTDLLRAVHPQGAGRFSTAELESVMNRIAADNHLASIHEVASGSTLQLGAYDVEVAERLGAHSSISVVTPMPPAPAIPPTVPIESAVTIPVEPETWNGFVHLYDAFFSVIGWLHDPWHIAGVLAGAGITAVIIAWLRRPSQSSTDNPYPAFMHPPSRAARTLQSARSPGSLFMVAGLLGGLSVPSFIPALLPWMMPLAAVLLAAYTAGRSPSLRRSRAVRWLYPLSAAACVAWLVPAGVFPIPIFAVTWALLQLVVSANSSVRWNGLYRWSRHRRWAPLGALLALLVFAPSFAEKVARPAWTWATQRYETLSQATTLGTNFGVSVQRVRLPVTWSPPENGVVSAVRLPTSTIQPGRLVVAYEPMAPVLWQRLQQVAQEVSGISGVSPLTRSRIESAGVRHHDAVILVQADFESSVDKKIREALDTLTALHQARRVEEAAWRQRSEAGETTRSFEQERLELELDKAVGLVNAWLREREGRNLRATRAFDLVRGSGVIAAGTELRRGAGVELFLQEFPDHRLVQVRLTPADALALERQWLRSPESAALQLKSGNNVPLRLPLSRVEEIVRSDDGTFPVEQEDFSGPQITHPALGVDPTLTLHLVVRTDAAWTRTQGPYTFEGVFDGEQRLLEEPAGLALGTLSLALDTASHPPHFLFRLEPLREEFRVLNKTIQIYEALIERIGRYQAENFDSAWARRAALDFGTRLDNLRSEASRVASDVALLEHSGAAERNGQTQPVRPFSYQTYPLQRAHAAASGQDALIAFGSGVRLRVVFYEETLRRAAGDSVRVRTPRAEARFQILGESSLDARYGLYRYEAEALLSPKEARRFFPDGLPLTETLVEVERETAVPAAPESPRRPHSSEESGAFLGIPAALISALRRLRRQSPPAESLDPDTFPWPMRHVFPADEKVSAPHPLFSVSPEPLDENQLTDLLSRLQNTALERERYWYAGDSTTYLSFWQFLTHSFRSKIKFKERRVLLRRYQRDDLTRWTAWLLDLTHYLETGREAAGNKTSTILWVWPWLIGVVSVYLFGSADLALEVTRLFTANPNVLAMAGHRVSSYVVSVLLGVLITGAAVTFGKGVGELIATTPYNITYLFMFMVRVVFRYNVEERFVREKTRLNKIYATQILKPGSKEYEDFMKDFNAFALQIAERAHARLSRDPFDRPSAESIAFENAFRIQIRRSQAHPSLIFPEEFPLELRPDAWHFEWLRRRGVDVSGPEEARELALQHARIHEAKELMRQYPIHTLMALFRAGTTELTAEIEKMPNKGLVRQLLEQIKDRTHTLDDDVFDGVRAQERFEDLFELLHYVFEGLRDSVTGHAPISVRNDIAEYWDPAVVPEERLTWIQFWDSLPRLLNREGKTPEHIEGDEGLVRMIAYALTLRRLKENEAAARALLERLRRRKPHPPEITMQDRYLRGPDGRPTTSVLELNLAYLKYFDLMTQLAGRFPDAALLGDRNIFLTCENTVNFRQALREIDLWLRLTRGRVTLVDVGGSNRHFADSLDDNMPRRIAPANADRVSVSSLEGARVRLARDQNALVISSATPLDWIILVQSAGELYHVPSELLSPASALLAIRDIAGDRLDELIGTHLRALRSRYLVLEQERRSLASRLEPGWPQYNEAGRRFLKVFQLGKSLHGTYREAKSYIPFKWQGWQLERLRRRHKAIAMEQDQLLKQMDELQALQREVYSVGHFLSRLGIVTAEFREGQDEKLPIVDDRAPMDGHWVVNVLFRLIRHSRTPPDDPAPESESPPFIWTPGNRSGVRFSMRRLRAAA